MKNNGLLVKGKFQKRAAWRGLFFALTFFAPFVAHAQTSTWNGGSGPADFTQNANWINGAPLNQDALVDTSSSSSPALTLGTNYSVTSLYINGAAASLAISPGGTLTLNGNSGNPAILFASSIYQGGSLSLSGGGIVSVAANSINVGRNADLGTSVTSGALTLHNGTQLNLDQAVYTNLNVGVGFTSDGTTSAYAEGTQGTVDQYDTSKVVVGSNMDLGYNGGIGTYTLHNSASLTTGTQAGSSYLYIGMNDVTDPSDTGGQFTQTSGSLILADSSSLTLGTNSEFVYLKLGDNRDLPGISGGTGVLTQQDSATVVFGTNTNLSFGNASGGTGTYNLKGGTLTIGNNQYTGFGTSAGSTGILNQTGGTLISSANVNIGYGGTGTYNLSAGTATFQNGLTVGAGSGSTGTVTQTGGVLSITGGALNLGQTNSSYNLTTGTLEVGGTNGITGPGTLAWDQGTLKVIGSSFTTSVKTTLTSGDRSLIDTNGFDATFSNNVTGATGGLTKLGAGNLELDGTNNQIASFYVNGGNLNQTTNSTLTTFELGVASGIGTTASYTMSSGSLIISTGTPPPLVNALASSMRIGDFGGTGTFNQSGGTVTLNGALNVGNQGGHGTYNLSGGTLNMESGQSALGRTSGSNTSQGGSTGAFNISGTGTLNIDGTTDFILSNWYPNDGLTQGTGVLTQSGGTVTVTNTAELYLTGLGDGTYNLNGGLLQVGGTSLKGVFSGENGSYHFNFGGGTIQVFTTTLATSVNVTFTSNTTSTVDTNGLGATMSGIFSGSGNLTKTGLGTLTLSGSNSSFTGTVNAEAGEVQVNGDMHNATVNVANAVTVSGTGSVGNLTVNSGGLLAPGSGGAGNLAVATLTLNSGAVMAFTLGTISNELLLGAFNKGTDGIIQFDFTTGVGFSYNTIYTLATFDSTTFSSGDLDNFSSNLSQGHFTITGNSLTYELVPEPSAYLMFLLGLGLMGIMIARRRTSRGAR